MGINCNLRSKLVNFVLEKIVENLFEFSKTANQMEVEK